jgi:hypothetical protein
MFNQMQVDRGDTLAGLIVKEEDLNGVYPVLYGRADGTFQ